MGEGMSSRLGSRMGALSDVSFFHSIAPTCKLRCPVPLRPQVSQLQAALQQTSRCREDQRRSQMDHEHQVGLG